jgi:hypothetical protein
MNLEDLTFICKKEDMKCGYAYAGSMAKLGIINVWVCIGQCIAWKRTPYIFALLSLENLVQDNTESMVKLIRSGKFGKNFVVQSLEYTSISEDMYCLGKVFEGNEINAWLSQLSLVGANIQYDWRTQRYGYIGDWETRKKVPCVSSFEFGKYYIKEPLYYCRRKTKSLEKKDIIWQFRGTRKVDGSVVYLWDELRCDDLRLGTSNARHHSLKTKYDDMLPFVYTDWTILQESYF